MSDIPTIACSINALATPGMKPKDLIAAVREKHPEASKKDVVRAAFYAVITQADADPEKAERIQNLALNERSSEDEDGAAKWETPRKRSKRKAGKMA